MIRILGNLFQNLQAGGTPRISIFICCILMAASCGSRSGISDNNSDSPICEIKSVTPAETAEIVPRTESEINGQRLFMSNCRQCHAPLDIQPCVGKSLRGIADRLPNTGVYLKAFIQNSDSLKKTGDPYANKLEAESRLDYEHKFKNLTEKEIGDILSYTNISIDNY
jgi:hypothetical protein